jgi:branched-chain amino acid transport system substrate-binding protein
MGTKKKILTFSLAALVISVAAVAFLLIRQSEFLKKETIFIAITAPMSGADKKRGEDMLKGIRLYLDSAKQLGNRTIELIIRDDMNNAAEAAKIASEIASDKRVLMVIGDFGSDTYASASPIYKKIGIPIITASCMTDETQADNEWYFSVVPDVAFQGSFIANYAIGPLKNKSACIIFEKSLYGTNLAKSFEEAANRRGIVIARKWSFETGKYSTQSEQIAQDFKTLTEPGMVFVAANGIESAKIVSELKSKIPSLSFIGTDSFTEEAFVSALKKSDFPRPDSSGSDIYAVSYFIPDIAGETADMFKKLFSDTYNHTPSSQSAIYYDAAHTAVEAILKADIQGKGHIRGDRKKVRDALAGFYRMENSVKGVTGHIYFNSKGSALKHLFVGSYQKDGFVPAFSQYKEATEPDSIGNIFKKTLDGRVILVQGNIINKIKIVFVGIHLKSVTSVKPSEYTADFDLWFRFRGEFKDADIEFTNSLNPVRLESPIREFSDHDVTTRIYHVNSAFRIKPDYHAYPLDEQVLAIRFRHYSETRNQLIYIPDFASPSEILGKDVRASLPDLGKEWKSTGLSFHTDVISNVSTLGSPKFFNKSNNILYSQFNAEISAKRNDAVFVVKVISPYIFILFCVSVIGFIRPQRFRLRLSGLLIIFIATIIFQLKFYYDVPAEYLLNADYFFFIIYTVIILTILVTVRGWICFFGISPPIEKGKI